MRDGDAMDEDEAEAGSPLSLADVVAALRRRMWAIAAFVVLVTSGAVLYALTLPNRYEAMATVQVDQRIKNISNVEGVISDLKADGPTVDSEVEVIRSSAVSLKVIDLLNLREDAEMTGTAPGFFGRLLGRQAVPYREEAPPPGGYDRVLAEFDSRFSAARVRSTLVMEIRFRSADPVKAARIVNTIAEVYVANQIAAKRKASEQATDLLDDRLKILREKVAVAEREVEAFKSANNFFDADGQSLIDRQIAREMETIVRARSDAAEAKARYEQARRFMLDGGESSAIAEVLRSNLIATLRDDLTKALRREAELATKYGPRHPEMMKVAADVATAQQELNAEAQKIIRNLRAEHDIAAERLRTLERNLEALKAQIAATKDLQWRLRELEREAAASRQLYETMLTRNKQTTETLDMHVADSRVVEVASAPAFPVGPKRKQIAIMAFLGSLVGSVGLVLLLEFMAPGLSRPEDVERAVAAPVLTMVPFMGRDAGGLGDDMRALRAMIAMPRGSLAEAVRSLRHEVDRRAPRDRARVISLASSLPDEGTTIIAANLALHYAILGFRTLLIDADLRRAELTGRLGVAGRPGLVEVLERRVRPEDAILRDSRTGLAVLPASSGGELAVSAAEILSSPQLGGLLDRFRREFDVVVIDAPPVLPVVDARMLADHADQIVLVVTSRRTPKTLVRRAVQLLGVNRAKLAGVVMNKVEQAVESRDYEAPSSLRNAA